MPPISARRWALVALALPAVAFAQPDDRSRLPSLTPAVFESRGTVSVALPVVDRQPLSGFGPPPRTFVVPADRQPVSRPFSPDLDALPALVLAPPPEPADDTRDLRRFRAEAGGGAHVSRYGRLDVSGASASGEFFVDADYDGVSGSDERVRFDRVNLRAGGRSFAPGRVRIEGYATLDGYDTPATIASARRRRRTLGAEVGLEGLGAAPYALAVGFEQGQLARTDDSEAETNEGRLDARGRLAFLQNRIRLDAAAGTAGDGGFGSDVTYGAVGGAVAFGTPEGARLVVGARLMAFDGSATAGGGDGQALGAIVDGQIPLGRARAFLTNDPHVGVRSLSDLTETNPYVQSDPIVFPDLVPVDARLGLEFRPGAARVRAYAMAMFAPTFLVFEQLGGEFGEAYVRATAGGLGGDITVAAPSGVSASAGLEIRAGTVEGGDDIPFYAPLVSRAGVQVPFLQGRGRVGLSGLAESTRPTTRSGARDAPAWGMVSLDARYDLVGPFSAVLRGERLVGTAERWPGSPEPPFTVMLGLRFAR